MYINYKKLMRNNYNLYITEERLAELKELAQKERTFIVNKYNVNNITSVLSLKAHDIAYVNMRNNKLSDAEKSIIANNIVFDDEKFVSILNKGKFETVYLQNFIKLTCYLKNKVDNNRISNDSDQRYLDTADMFAKRLVNHFSKYVGVVDCYIIINKLNEILSFRPELLEDVKKNNVR